MANEMLWYGHAFRRDNDDVLRRRLWLGEEGVSDRGLQGEGKWKNIPNSMFFRESNLEERIDQI